MSDLPFEELKAMVMLNRSGKKKEISESLSAGERPGDILSRLLSSSPRIESEQAAPENGEPIISFYLEAMDPEKEIRNCAAAGIKLLTYLDADYPAPLKQIYDPPLVLYLQGDILPGDISSLAIVGTRHPGLYGMNHTRLFSRALAEAGLTIISGFAKGIDQTAHNAALEISYGRTIAVLGCGLDIDYPKDSRGLFERIKQRGAVISEYGLGTPPHAANFPRRNRIISGLSLGVFVVEAHLRSGSLITAHSALEQGREVFALPGPVDKLTSSGSHRLIKEGAVLVEKPEDILEALNIPLARTQREICQSSETDVEKKGEKSVEFLEMPLEVKLIGCLKTTPLTSAEWLDKSGLSVALFNPLMTFLEMKRRVKRLPDGRYEAVQS